MPAPARRQQRREFFRMPVHNGLCIRSMAPDANTVPAAPARILPIVDLSGGGCLCEDPEQVVPAGARVAARMELDDGEPAIEFEALAVRRTTVNNVGAVGFRFTAIRERDRERLLRYLFRTYRRARLAGTGDGSRHL